MRILVFAPHAAVWAHSFPEALVAEALQRSGHEITYVTCGTRLSAHCTAMSARGISPAASAADKAEVCRACVSAKRLIRHRFGFDGFDIDERLTPADDRDIAALMATVERSRPLELVVDGIEVARLALYEPLLHAKKTSCDFTDEEWPRCLIYIRNALSVLFACRRVFADAQFDRVLCYNSLYGVNHVCCRYAQLRGIAYYTIHAGGNLSNRLQTLMLTKGMTSAYSARNISKLWPEVRDWPCSALSLSRVTDHLLRLFQGSSVFVYSTPMAGGDADVRSRFSVAPGQRLLVATMSSYDERFAAEVIGAIDQPADPLFPTQLEWVRALVALVATRRDLALIIRVHPRELPNRRDPVHSEHARQLHAALSDLPDNCHVNWPSDGVSLYDLAKHADVFLNAWSSAGVEMALLGLPVVSYSAGLLYYPADLNLCGGGIEAYLAHIDEALDQGWSEERMRAAYRWFALEHGGGLFSIAEAIPDRDRPRPPLLRAVEKAMRPWMDAPGQVIDAWLRPRHLREAERIAAIIVAGRDGKDAAEAADRGLDLAEETAGLRSEAARLVSALSVGGTDGPLLHKLAAFADPTAAMERT